MTRVVAPRGPYQKGIRRRREIVDAASRIFARYGYGGGSLRQIADDVGVTPAALARHFENKYGLLQAVLVHWEEEVDHTFDGAHGLEYFRVLPGPDGRPHDRARAHRAAADSLHRGHRSAAPGAELAVQRYARVTNLGAAFLREARDLGEIAPMTDEQIEIEARGVVALMDGMQLQWLLDPSLPLVQMFQAQLDTILKRWERGAKRRRPRTRSSGPAVSGSPGDPALISGGPARDLAAVRKKETGASASRA